jgi:hypothetical protein
MATKAKRPRSQDPTSTPTLLLAFEVGVSTWRLGFTPGAQRRLTTDEATSRGAGLRSAPPLGLDIAMPAWFWLKSGDPSATTS